MDGLRVVRSGLAPTDRIVIEGLQRARAGQKVAAEDGKIRTRAPNEPPPAPLASSRSARLACVFALLHRPADLRGGAVDRPRAGRRHRVPRAAGRASIRRSRRPPSWCARPIPAPTPRSSPTPSRRRSSRRSTASRTCSTCRPTRPATARCRSRSPSSSAPTSTGAGAGAEPRGDRLPRLPEEVRARRDHAQELARPDDGRASALAGRNATTSSTSRTTPACNVRDVLLRLDGVGDVIVFGEREYSMRVWLDPDKLGARPDRRRRGRRCRSRTCRSRAARIGQPPATPRPAPSSSRCRRKGRFETREQFADHRQSTAPTGASCGCSDRPRRARRAGLRHQRLSQRQAGGGARHLPAAGSQRALTAAAASSATMDELAKISRRASPTDRLQPDRVHRRESVDEVYKTLFEAVVLVVIVVIVFLQSWRAAIIPIVAIPVSLIGTFASWRRSASRSTT